MTGLLFTLAAGLFLALCMAASLNKSYFHLCAYTQAAAAALTNSAMGTVADGILTSSTTTTFVAPSEAEIMWAFSTGPLVTRARINTPSYRLVSLPSLVPINASATVPSPANVMDLTMNPLKVPKVDALSVEITDTGGVGEQAQAVLCLMFDYKPVPKFQLENGRQVPAKRFRIRATGAITGVANSWANGGLTLDQALQNGQYVVVGMDVVAVNAIAARLIFAGTGYRPGVICRNAVGSVRHRLFDGDAMGCFGTFENINTPQLDLFLGAGGANTSQEVFLDLIRVGEPGESPGL